MVEKTIKHSLVTDVRGRELPCELRFCNYMRENIAAMHRYVLEKYDNVGLICGYEGSGKSALAMQIALALDADFSIDRIVFTQEDFMDLVDRVPKHGVILWDEADEMAAHHASRNLQVLKKKMKRIRTNNLHIIWVTPTAWDLNKYFTIGRARWLIHVYSKGWERGFLRFFTGDNKRQLVMNGRRDWNWYGAKPNFHTSFADYPVGFPIDMDAYDEKKTAATRALNAGDDEPDSVISSHLAKKIRKKYLENLYKWLASNDVKMTQADMGFVFDIKSNTVNDYLRELGYTKNGVDFS